MRLLLTAVAVFGIAATAQEPVERWTPDDPCPTAIHARIPNIQFTKSAFGSYESVHQAMRMCSNITELHMVNLGSTCVDRPDGYNLPFKLDGKERYLSAPQVLSVSGYDFNFREWNGLLSFTPEWAPVDGSWPRSSSTNPYIVRAVDMFYRARWHWEHLLTRMLRNTPMGPGPNDVAFWDFGESRRWYDRRDTPRERRDLDNAQLWLEAMDFSQVHTLFITDYMVKPQGKGLFEDLPRALTGLRTLEVDGTWETADPVSFARDDCDRQKRDQRKLNEDNRDGGAATPDERWESIIPPARDFITAVHPLDSLTWTRSGTLRDDVFEPIIKRHGSTLKHLEWTNPELRFKNRPILSVEQIRNLGERAPGLTNLTIDLDRVDGTWPWKHLKAISESMPKLTNLTINLDRHDATAPPKSRAKEDLLAKPSLTEKAALDIFHILNLFKARDKIQNLQLRQVDWEDPWDESNWGAEWMEGKRIWANCALKEERGVMKSKCEEGHTELFGFEW
ncbi:hypothetical protein NW752_009489 [Fusarium irregulare]|uniref:Uncharacterized protein n=1 Tax=Fusarium irregulare TaxID=2494466 RepID=A0A9W8PFA4_9HYPO|nr:hypothetical protein NW766_011581 [Fusarium irregulare]KAJ4009190.1 hypothetical protein NW752_009489 [Fusarium irregulare]